MCRKNFLLVLFYTDTLMVNRENQTCLTSFRVQALSTEAVSYDESEFSLQSTGSASKKQNKNKGFILKALSRRCLVSLSASWRRFLSLEVVQGERGVSLLTADDAIGWSYLFICLYLRVAVPGFLKPVDYKQVFHRRSCSWRTTFGFLTAVSSSKEIPPPILHQCTALTLAASPHSSPSLFPHFALLLFEVKLALRIKSHPLFFSPLSHLLPLTLSCTRTRF